MTKAKKKYRKPQEKDKKIPVKQYADYLQVFQLRYVNL